MTNTEALAQDLRKEVNNPDESRVLGAIHRYLLNNFPGCAYSVRQDFVSRRVLIQEGKIVCGGIPIFIKPTFVQTVITLCEVAAEDAPRRLATLAANAPLMRPRHLYSIILKDRMESL